MKSKKKEIHLDELDEIERDLKRFLADREAEERRRLDEILSREFEELECLMAEKKIEKNAREKK